MTPIFLLSLPRSGSTLLQRLLARNKGIATCDEPWLLLPLLSAFDTERVAANHDQTVLVRALEDLRDRLPTGQAGWDQAVRSFAHDVYGQVAGEAEFFLDKTPRYSIYAEDILRIFPEARFIVLWRDPLAIIQSINDTWGGGRWSIHRHSVDLFDAMAATIRAVQSHPDRILALRYENLLENPETAIEEIWSGLGLLTDSLRDTDIKLDGRMGDPKRHVAGRAVSAQSTDWRKRPVSILRKWWMRRYIHWLGSERMSVMGYDFEAFSSELEALPISWRTFPRDLVQMSLAPAYRFVSPPLLRRKWNGLIRGRSFHVHK